MIPSKKKILPFILLLIGALIVPASTRLSYTGPNRPASAICEPGQTVKLRTQKDNQDNNSCAIKLVAEFSCTDPSQPWKQYPALPFAYQACESYPDLWIESESLPTMSNTPPATVSGGMACSKPGSNGWCRGGALLLSANEPLAGEQISVIESSNRGKLCTINAANGGCAWTPPDGTGSTNFWAVSTFGDTSEMGTANWQFDSIPPKLVIGASPIPDGLNGWYVNASPLLSLLTSDATSGVAGAAFENGSSSITISQEGVYNISASAEDRAGNTTSSNIIIKKDATPPRLIIPVAPDGSNGWYVTLPTLSLIGSDNISGLSSAAFDNGEPTYPITTQGIRTVTAHAADTAGNTTSATATVSVDTVPPALIIASPVADGLNGWYITFPTLALISSDATSGPASASFSNGQATMPIKADGSYDVSATAFDRAGNKTSAIKAIRVDTTSPAISMLVPDAPDGLNGWYKSTPTLSLEASDATSGLTSAKFENGGSSYTPADGLQTVSATARDNAGNAKTISQTLKVDSVPPTLTPSISGGSSSGWFNTSVTVSLNAQDATSGVGEVGYRLDGGSWQSGSEVTISADGEHTLEVRVVDKAGNTATAVRSFKLDTTPPQSAFTTPSKDGQIKAFGVVELAGSSSDSLSGLAGNEISLDDGASWQMLPLSNGLWKYSWDTTRIPDGSYTILVHADDEAGNRENAASVQVIVGNKPPKVDIQASWWLWEAGSFKVEERQIPLRDVTARISCAPYHPDVVVPFYIGNIPSTLKWDRLCGNGAYAAESGDYAVTITACDTLSHCAEADGVIKVPFIAPPMPTWTPTVEPTKIETPPNTRIATPMPTVQKMVSPTVQPVVTAVPTPVSSPRTPASPIFVFALSAFALGFCFVAITDKRSRALHRLAQTIRKLE